MGQGGEGYPFGHARISWECDAAELVLLHYDHHFDLIAEVTGQRTEWVAPAGRVP